MATWKLPLDVIIDILIRLPGKSLLRFRCISKSFRSLIDSKDFTNLHLSRSIKTSSNRSLVICSELDYNSKTRFHSLSLDSLGDGDDDGSIIDLRVNEMFDIIIGSCNGLLALKNYPKGIILLNPLTKKHRVLPKFCGDLHGDKPSLHGFGYDVGSDDYKLVRIHVFKSPVYHIEATVYGLKVNLWRRIKNIKNFPYSWADHSYGGNGAFVNGALHWLANQNQDEMINDLILAFDLNIETFYSMPMPSFGNEGGGGELSGVYVLKGCLSLLCKYSEPWDLWVMKEYGVKDSWSKLFTMNENGYRVIPLAFSSRGDKVLFQKNSKDHCWYHLDMHRVESLLVKGPSDVHVCVDTLVSPFAESNRSLKKKKTRKRRKGKRN